MPKGRAAYITSSKVHFLEPAKFQITELPVGQWTQNYKELLENLLNPQKKENAKTAAARKKKAVRMPSCLPVCPSPLSVDLAAMIAALVK